MASKKSKKKDEVIEKEKFILPMDVNDEVAKPNLKLLDKIEEIEKILTEQGLGQNARQKVFVLFDELRKLKCDKHKC